MSQPTMKQYPAEFKERAVKRQSSRTKPLRRPLATSG